MGEMYNRKCTIIETRLTGDILLDNHLLFIFLAKMTEIKIGLDQEPTSSIQILLFLFHSYSNFKIW